MRYLIILLVGALAACGESTDPRLPDTPYHHALIINNNFDQFKEEFVETLWRLDPSWASYEGRHDYDSLLTIPSVGQRQAEAEAYAALDDSLATFLFDSLTTDNQMDWLMMGHFLRRQAWYRDTLQAYVWDPSEYNVGGSLARLLTARHDSLDVRLRALLVRMRFVPEYYAAAKANIKNPTPEHTALAIEQNQGTMNVLASSFLDSLDGSGLTEAEQQEFRANLAAAQGAVADYVAFLKDLQDDLTPGAARSFRLGEDLYRRKFALDIVSRLSAEEMYQAALQRKAYLHGEMAQLADSLWGQYVGGPQPTDSLQMIRQVIDRIALNHTDREDFVETIRQQIPELAAFVREQDLLTLDPNEPLVVRETPEYMRGVAGASVSAPGPYDKGADTYYNVTPLDHYDAAGAESYLREYNDYTLQILNIHEAIPGHYAQLVYSNKSPSIVKSILSNGAMVEGWAVYSELMMLEAGYNPSPELWLMYYKWNLRVTMNTIIDYEIQTQNLSREAAIDKLMNEAFQERAEAEGKWRRATVSQVQLTSYFSGFREILDLRETLRKRQGGDFDLKAFHEKFLSYGSAPVRFIRAAMLADLEAQSAS